LPVSGPLRVLGNGPFGIWVNQHQIGVGADIEASLPGEAENAGGLGDESGHVGRRQPVAR
jgi:hypothetical protein